MMNKDKILVIDDDPIVLKSCKRVLESENYSVTLCSSIKEAITIIEEYKFHLIIIDIVMPAYNGVDLPAWIGRDHPDAKTLIISGYIEPKPFSEIIKREDTNFLSKPFTPYELLAAVKKATIDTLSDRGITIDKNTEGDIK